MREKRPNLFVMGADGVGKSALIVRLATDHFIDSYGAKKAVTPKKGSLNTCDVECSDPTMGEPCFRQFTVDGETCAFHVIEQEPSDASALMLHHNHMRSCAGFVLMYSMASRSSFEHVSSLYHRLRQVRTHPLPEPAIVIVGNKCDLDEDMRAVSTKEGAELAQSLGCAFLETSAKTRVNVEETFFELVRQLRQTSACNDEKHTKKRGRSTSSSNDRCIVS